MSNAWLVGVVWIAVLGIGGTARADEAAGGGAAALWSRVTAAEQEKEPDAETASALVALGERATWVLVQGLGSAEGWHRTRAAELLERIGPRASKAVPALIDALYDRSWTTRRQAAYALAAMGEAGKAALPALWRGVREPATKIQYPKDEPSDRDAFAWSILSLDGDLADTARELLLRKPTSRVLYTYLETDPDRLRPVLSTMLQSESWHVRDSAIWVLSYVVEKLGEREPWLPVLGRLTTQDPVPAVRRSATRALQRLVTRAHVAIDPLLFQAGLVSSDPEMRALAVETLAHLKVIDPEQVRALVRILEQDPGADLRRGAALALRHAESSEARLALEKSLEDADVRPAAAVALARLGSVEPEVLTLVADVALARGANRRWDHVLVLCGGGGRRLECRTVDMPRLAEKALAALGAAAVPAIEAHLQAESTSVREHALLLLGRLGKPGPDRIRRAFGAVQLEARREAAAVLFHLDVTEARVVHVLLDAAVEDECDALGDNTGFEGVDWRRTTQGLLSHADPLVILAVLAHARGLVPNDWNWEDEVGPSNMATALPMLELHAALIRGMGEAARPILEKDLQKEPLAPWVRYVLKTMPHGNR